MWFIEFLWLGNGRIYPYPSSLPHWHIVELGQSYDYPNGSEATLQYMGKFIT